MSRKMSVILSKKLKQLRQENCLTQEQLAQKIGVSRVNYNRYENGKVLPDYDVIVTIADYYDISLDELFDRKRYY